MQLWLISSKLSQKTCSDPYWLIVLRQSLECLKSRCTSKQVSWFKKLILGLGLREIKYLIYCNKELEQYTSFNCLDHYSTQLKGEPDSHSSKDYLCALRHFERIY